MVNLPRFAGPERRRDARPSTARQAPPYQPYAPAGACRAAAQMQPLRSPQHGRSPYVIGGDRRSRVRSSPWLTGWRGWPASLVDVARPILIPVPRKTSQGKQLPMAIGEGNAVMLWQASSEEVLIGIALERESLRVSIS